MPSGSLGQRRPLRTGQAGPPQRQPASPAPTPIPGLVAAVSWIAVWKIRKRRVRVSLSIRCPLQTRSPCSSDGWAWLTCEAPGPPRFLGLYMYSRNDPHRRAQCRLLPPTCPRTPCFPGSQLALHHPISGLWSGAGSFDMTGHDHRPWAWKQDGHVVIRWGLTHAVAAASVVGFVLSSDAGNHKRDAHIPSPCVVPERRRSTRWLLPGAGGCWLPTRSGLLGRSLDPAKYLNVR